MIGSLLSAAAERYVFNASTNAGLVSFRDPVGASLVVSPGQPTPSSCLYRLSFHPSSFHCELNDSIALITTGHTILSGHGNPSSRDG